ncbi:MAG: tetratricopeptide repeat protein, partial [Blastocatellia bacterium]
MWKRLLTLPALVCALSLPLTASSWRQEAPVYLQAIALKTQSDLRKPDPPSAKQDLLQQSLNRGAAHLQRNEKDQALRELKKAVALDPNSAAAHHLLGQA